MDSQQKKKNHRPPSEPTTRAAFTFDAIYEEAEKIIDGAAAIDSQQKKKNRQPSRPSRDQNSKAQSKPDASINGEAEMIIDGAAAVDSQQKKKNRQPSRPSRDQNSKAQSKPDASINGEAEMIIDGAAAIDSQQKKKNRQPSRPSRDQNSKAQSKPDASINGEAEMIIDGAAAIDSQQKKKNRQPSRPSRDQNSKAQSKPDASINGEAEMIIDGAAAVDSQQKKKNRQPSRPSRDQNSKAQSKPDASINGEAEMIIDGAAAVDSQQKKKNRQPSRPSRDQNSKAQSKPDASINGEAEMIIDGAAAVDSQQKKKNRQPSRPSSESTMRTVTTFDATYGKGQKIIVLHVAEKPSIAQAICKGLCTGNQVHSSGKGLPVHEFNNVPFPKAPHASTCTHKVTSVAGHVFSVDFPASYQSWDQIDPADLFQAPIQKSPCKGSVVKHLHEVAKGVDFVVLWLDCDREGENIAFEVLECTLHLMHANRSSDDNSNMERVYRAHFSAINPSDIQKAYNSLGKPDKNQSLSVDARQELDLKVGVAFSRFQTRYFQGRYGDLDSALLSYGPCQTPTLGFCAQRYIDIETFKPEPYWTLTLNMYKRGKTCRATWDSGRSFHRSKVESLLDRTKVDGSTVYATVTSIAAKDKKQGRPSPLNTVNLLKICSKVLGIGPHSAMQTAERLYLSGYLSYPRTESTAYPKSFDFYGALQEQVSDPRWGDSAKKLLTVGPNKSKGGIDMGDHPPVTPCRAAGPHDLSGDMARIYELVTRHFIASISPDALWKRTTISFEITALGDDGKFTVRGKELIQPGFLDILFHKGYDDSDEYLGNISGDDDCDGELLEEGDEEQCLPDFELGESIPLIQTAGPSSSKLEIVNYGSRATLEVKEKMTSAPTFLTESELINKMEKNGIGTDASIATHIENILKRHYVELLPGRKLKPTKLGLVLAQGYHLIDSSLVLPKVRSDIEDQCKKIALGLADKESVVKNALIFFAEKFQNFVKNINKMDLLFSSSFTQLQEVGKAFTRCGLTRKYLQFIAGPPPRLYNKFTETVYPLPAGGIVKEWTGRKCSAPGCNFELCMYSVGEPERTFPLCPYCFNNPKPEWGPIPGEDNVDSSDPIERVDEAKERHYRRLGGRSLLLECPLPDGHPLIKEMTVSPDPDDEGVFTIDAHLGPKWRLVGTRSPTVVFLPKIIEKITILEKTYDDIGSHVMRIEFKEPPPYHNGSKKYDCCFSTDEPLQKLSRFYKGQERAQRSSNGGRRGGRGGGQRGGRGGRGISSRGGRR